MMTDDLTDWCDDNLPDLYNVGMFDEEDIADDVWDAVHDLASETLLDFLEDSADRAEMEEALHDAAETWFRAHHQTLIDSLPMITPDDIQTLMNKPQVAQHSADWYAQRRNRLTASEFHNILTGSRGAMVRSKLESADPGDRATGGTVAIAQEDGDMVATSWGHRFEPVTCRIYELEIAGDHTVCDTVGRFNHPTIPWFSASPDGLVTKGPLIGRLVEIKSPKTRQPGTYVPSEYYSQMQVQMEVCQSEAVDFVEAQFQQRSEDVITEEDADDIEVAPWKGRIQVYGWLENQSSWCYRYSEPVEDMEDAELPPPPENLPLLESSVWWLTGWYPRTVLRNHQWWEAVGWPAAQEFWSDVQAAREAEKAAKNGDTIVHVTESSTKWLGGSWKPMTGEEDPFEIYDYEMEEEEGDETERDEEKKRNEITTNENVVTGGTLNLDI
jgi:hypothetical protein